MKLSKYLSGVVALAAAIFLGSTTTNAATSEMVDVSNHNGYMSTSDWVGMRDNYGVKAMVTKISEGTYYHDYTAANNISTAKAAGLYTNGYHFARYSNAAQAEAEANYTASLAKADGLEIGSVLVADVEAPEQQATGYNSNNYNNFIFMSTINRWGYRSDVYTMSSWLDNRLNISSGEGWIASYPYDASNKAWYSAHHAWQWGSTFSFPGTTATGVFDVSQLYDDYYTGGQTPIKYDPNNITIKYEPGYGIDSVTATGWGYKDSRNKFKHGTSWHSNGIAMIDGRAYYLVGPNEYVPQQFTDQQYIATINYTDGYGIDAVNSDGVGVGGRETFVAGSQWKADYVKEINGRLYYQVGPDQFIDSDFTNGSGKTY